MLKKIWILIDKFDDFVSLLKSMSKISKNEMGKNKILSYLQIYIHNWLIKY
jgi:hypothetical protein